MSEESIKCGFITQLMDFDTVSEKDMLTGAPGQSFPDSSGAKEQECVGGSGIDTHWMVGVYIDDAPTDRATERRPPSITVSPCS